MTLRLINWGPFFELVAEAKSADEEDIVLMQLDEQELQSLITQYFNHYNPIKVHVEGGLLQDIDPAWLPYQLYDCDAHEVGEELDETPCPNCGYSLEDLRRWEAEEEEIKAYVRQEDQKFDQKGDK